MAPAATRPLTDVMDGASLRLGYGSRVHVPIGACVELSAPSVERIPFGIASCAVVCSSLLRAPWLLLVLIMPRSAFGAVVFYLVVASAGIVLLQWALSWFDWTISLGAALAARAFPGLLAATFAGLEGFHASVRAVLAVALLELIFATFVVGLTAVRPQGWNERGTGFDPGQLLPSLRHEAVAWGHETDWDADGGGSVESVVRAARKERLSTGR